MASKPKAPKRTIIKKIDLSGETRRGDALWHAFIYDEHDTGSISVGFSTDYFRTYGYQSVEAAEAYIAQSLDSYVPPRHAYQTKAQDLLSKWGGFITKAERARIVEEILLDPRLEPTEFRWLRAKMNEIEARAQYLLDNLPAYVPPNDLDMSDAEVAAAIRLLTEADRDHAKERNKKGWNALDSKLGHWCYAMLNGHREEALYTARGFVGNYERQLVRGGVL